MSARLAVLAATTGIGVTLALTACVSSSQHAHSSLSPAQWAAQNDSLITHVGTLANEGDINGAVSAWDAIPVPPTNPDGWLKATADLNAAGRDYSDGDVNAAQNDANRFASDLGDWAKTFTYQAGGLGG